MTDAHHTLVADVTAVRVKDIYHGGWKPFRPSPRRVAAQGATSPVRSRVPPPPADDPHGPMGRRATQALCGPSSSSSSSAAAAPPTAPPYFLCSPPKSARVARVAIMSTGSVRQAAALSHATRAPAAVVGTGERLPNHRSECAAHAYDGLRSSFGQHRYAVAGTIHIAPVLRSQPPPPEFPKISESHNDDDDAISPRSRETEMQQFRSASQCSVSSSEAGSGAARGDYEKNQKLLPSGRSALSLATKESEAAAAVRALDTFDRDVALLQAAATDNGAILAGPVSPPGRNRTSHNGTRSATTLAAIKTLQAARRQQQVAVAAGSGRKVGAAAATGEKGAVGPPLISPVHPIVALFAGASPPDVMSAYRTFCTDQNGLIAKQIMALRPVPAAAGPPVPRRSNSLRRNSASSTPVPPPAAVEPSEAGSTRPTRRGSVRRASVVSVAAPNPPSSSSQAGEARRTSKASAVTPQLAEGQGAGGAAQTASSSSAVAAAGVDASSSKEADAASSNDGEHAFRELMLCHESSYCLLPPPPPGGSVLASDVAGSATPRTQTQSSTGDTASPQQHQLEEAARFYHGPLILGPKFAVALLTALAPGGARHVLTEAMAEDLLRAAVTSRAASVQDTVQGHTSGHITLNSPAAKFSHIFAVMCNLTLPKAVTEDGVDFFLACFDPYKTGKVPQYCLLHSRFVDKYVNRHVTGRAAEPVWRCFVEALRSLESARNLLLYGSEEGGRGSHESAILQPESAATTSSRGQADAARRRRGTDSSRGHDSPRSSPPRPFKQEATGDAEGHRLRPERALEVRRYDWAIRTFVVKQAPGRPAGVALDPVVRPDDLCHPPYGVPLADARAVLLGTPSLYACFEAAPFAFSPVPVPAALGAAAEKLRDAKQRGGVAASDFD